jgi:Bacterial Ig domain
VALPRHRRARRSGRARRAFACTISSPALSASLTVGVPVQITGTISQPGLVSVKINSVLLGLAVVGGFTAAGFTWSYSWTPQAGDAGTPTINASASAVAPGVPAGNAPGVSVTVSPIVSPPAWSGIFSDLFTAPSLGIQGNKGLTYGVTPKPAGTSPPAVGFGGTRKFDNAKPLLVKTSAGALGTATYAIYFAGVGTTVAQSGTTAASAAVTAFGSKSSKASPVSDRQPPHLNTPLGRATLPGRATRAKCWFT